MIIVHWSLDDSIYLDLVNECELGYDKCHQNASCTDLPYTLYGRYSAPYHCQCHTGFVGDGEDCQSKYS